MSKIYILIAITGEYGEIYKSTILASFDKKILEDKIVELEANYKITKALFDELHTLYEEISENHPLAEVEITRAMTRNSDAAREFWEKRYKEEEEWVDEFWKPKALELYAAKGITPPEEFHFNVPASISEEAYYTIEEIAIV
jgi:hypothetical protein